MRNNAPIRDDVPESDGLKRLKVQGEVRIRSNVSSKSTDWHLVPGDVLKRYGQHYGHITEEQHDEMMYYEPCSICRRTIFEINEGGCDHPPCRKQGILPTANAERRK